MRLLRYIKSGLAALVAMAMLPSCNSIMEDGGVCPESDSVMMSFKMITAAHMSGTRADNNGHKEVDSEFREFEDGINVRDFAFFIFAGEGEDAKLVVKNTDIASSTDPTTMITGSPGAYTVTVKIAKEDLERVLGRPVEPGSSKAVNFRFVIFANCYSPVTGGNPSGGGNLGLLTGITYGEVIDQASKWGFDMEEIYSPSENTDSSIDGLFKGNIPMFGTNSFSVTEGALYASRPDERIYLGEIDLLRALAKVRVADNIGDKDLLGFPRIERVEILSSQSHARQLPDDAVNYRNGTQVHTPNIFDVNAGLLTGDATEYWMGYIPKGWESPEVEGVKTRIAYIPEQKIGNADGNINNGLPCFRITVGLKGKVNDLGIIEATDTEEYDVPMTGYDGKNFEFGDNILRNHIYTLSVNQVNVGVPADITISVREWNESTLNLDYTKNVNVSDPLRWLSGFDENGGNDTDKGTVVMQPWHAGEPVELVGTFGISTPLNAVWTAELIVTEGNQGAFMFEVENPDGTKSREVSVSGTIDGKTLSEIRIVSTDPEPKVSSRAKLVVTVRLADGTYMEAPLCGDHDYKNYTIIQNSL